MSVKTIDTSVHVIVDFLESIGLTVAFTKLLAPTFLPGVDIVEGCLHVDLEQLAYPGDLLHEAGHVAVVTPAERCSMTGNLHSDPGDEMAAIAWSWAALKHLNLSPEVVFHEDGYHGGSQSIIENFSVGRYCGVPMLVRSGMTNDPGYDREREGLEESVFPDMLKWLRD